MKKLCCILALPLLLSACNPKESVIPANDCSNVFCTAIFASISVDVEDKNGSPVELYNYYTINRSNNDTLRPLQSSWGKGTYTVVDDSYTSKMYNKTYEFSFVGIVNNQVIINEPFTISADCCHVSKVSGKESVTIN